MNIKRFFGKNSREALNMVRKALGEDAVIISNKSTDGGTEIMAVSEADMQAMANEHVVIERKPAKTAMPAFEEESTDIGFNDTNAFEDAPTLLSLISQNKSRVTQTETKQVATPSEPVTRLNAKQNTTVQSTVVQNASNAQHQS